MRSKPVLAGNREGPLYLSPPCVLLLLNALDGGRDHAASEGRNMSVEVVLEAEISEFLGRDRYQRARQRRRIAQPVRRTSGDMVT
jgi:hypothetical protein